jgi:hypothetical protein
MAAVSFAADMLPLLYVGAMAVDADAVPLFWFSAKKFSRV